MGEFGSVLIFGEYGNQGLSEMALQLLGIGRRIADASGRRLHVLILSPEPGKDADQFIFYGADKVFSAVDPVLKDYTADLYLQAIEHFVATHMPDIVLFGQDDKGMDLAPRLAFRLKTSVCLDCIDMQIEQGGKALKLVKPVFGGKAQCHCYGAPGKLSIVTIRDRAFDSAVYDGSRAGEVEHIGLALDGSKIRMRLLEKQEDNGQSVAQKLRSAKIVVGGGRGLGGKEGFECLGETAEILGGTVAGSRPAVDYGWVHKALQVGLTGQKIAPELYFAIAISGSIQHMAGCLKSKVIVSINVDEDAPIFLHSHYGVVGNYMEVLRGFNNECKRLR